MDQGQEEPHEEHREPEGPEDRAPAPSHPEGVTQPGKLVRLLGMTRHLLEEMHYDHLDQPARARVQTTHRESLRQLRGLLGNDNLSELDRLLAPFAPGESAEPTDPPPSATDLRLAEAQLYGWLEGLLKGLEADEAARQVGHQAEQMDRLQTQQPQPDEPHGYR